jgi:hypothetical protein
MSDKVYVINKGINKAIEFKGLKAQYIWFVAGAAVGTMILFAVMYVSGLSSYVCVPVALGVGGFLGEPDIWYEQTLWAVWLDEMARAEGDPCRLVVRIEKFLYSFIQ